MKICMLADGESIHTIRWCRHFHTLGHEIHLVSFKDVKIDGITVHYVSSGNIKVAGGNWKVIFKYKEVKAILKKIKPDVLHSLYATSYGMVGALTGFHPYIITPLGSDILVSPKESIIYRSLLKYAFKKADLITSMAPHMKDAMIEMGVLKNKITDVVLGINTEVFNATQRKPRKDEFVITSTRNFEPVYNIPQFILAVSKIKDKIPNLKVIMAGDGSLKMELVRMAKDLGLEDIITFTGKLPQNRIVEILNTSHVFVTVSFSDGNSLSLIEAMACGAYPVASDIPANREWIREGINGNFVKTGDADQLAGVLLAIQKNYESVSLKAIAESSRIISEKGTWQVNMAKMEKYYKKLAGNGG